MASRAVSNVVRRPGHWHAAARVRVGRPHGAGGRRRRRSAFTDYVVGPQDVLTITSYDQADLSGKFAVEADGTFTYPMIGRVKAGGLTLRALEGAIKKQLNDDGYFKNPQITVSVDTYKSQRVFIVGEVRTPGHLSAVGQHQPGRGAGPRRLDAADARAAKRSSSTPARMRTGRRCRRRPTPRTSSASTCASSRTAPSRRTRGCATATPSSCRAPRASTCSAR